MQNKDFGSDLKMAKKVAVIMGSDSDFPVVEAGIKELRAYGIETEVHVFSAHRTPGLAADYAKSARARGFGVIICAAGMSAHLAGVIAAHTTLPIIGIPINSTLQGLDALLSTVMMPPGVPVATVGVGGAKNAAILAVQILAVSDEALAEKLAQAKLDMENGVIKKDKEIQNKL
jgi:5-(carboxyamino)imidazole ribonucleotide mutase